ncbi:hypothetical protein MTO96_002466 [Rhipicephalus appendiculatus]
MQYVITNAGIYCWEVRSRGYSAQATYPGMVVSQLAYCKERVQDTTLTVQSYTVNETTCKVRCQLYRLHQVRLGSTHLPTKELDVPGFQRSRLHDLWQRHLKGLRTRSVRKETD